MYFPSWLDTSVMELMVEGVQDAGQSVRSSIEMSKGKCGTWSIEFRASESLCCHDTLPRTFMKWQRYWPEYLIVGLAVLFEAQRWPWDTSASSPLISTGWTAQRKLAARYVIDQCNSACTHCSGCSVRALGSSGIMVLITI